MAPNTRRFTRRYGLSALVLVSAFITVGLFWSFPGAIIKADTVAIGSERFAGETLELNSGCRRSPVFFKTTLPEISDAAAKLGRSTVVARQGDEPCLDGVSADDAAPKNADALTVQQKALLAADLSGRYRISIASLFVVITSLFAYGVFVYVAYRRTRWLRSGAVALLHVVLIAVAIGFGFHLAGGTVDQRKADATGMPHADTTRAYSALLGLEKVATTIGNTYHIVSGGNVTPTTGVALRSSITDATITKYQRYFCETFELGQDNASGGGGFDCAPPRDLSEQDRANAKLFAAPLRYAAEAPLPAVITGFTAFTLLTLAGAYIARRTVVDDVPAKNAPPIADDVVADYVIEIRDRWRDLRVCIAAGALLLILTVVLMRSYHGWAISLLAPQDARFAQSIAYGLVSSWAAYGSVLLFMLSAPILVSILFDIDRAELFIRHEAQQKPEREEPVAKIEREWREKVGLQFSMRDIVSGLGPILTPALSAPLLESLIRAGGGS